MRAKVACLAAFAVAMAFVEAAVVVYVREIIGAGPIFPMKEIPALLLVVELGRETATIVILVSVAVLSVRGSLRRMGAFLLAFAVWDIFYYVWLYATIGWPAGLADWDVLFLIPLPWVGPVWSVLLISTGMIAFSVCFLGAPEDAPFSPGPWGWASGVAGAGTVVATSRLRPDPAQEPKVRYLAKGTVPNHGEERVSSGHRDYDYLEWIARLTSHIPDRGTQLVHYYGAYSNAHRGIARRREVFVEVPPEDEPSDPPRPDSAWLAARRKSWARLIRRVYEVDPFLCPCGERMRVVGFITQAPVIRKILTHIGRRFDPLKLPGRSPPLWDDFCPDPFPDYGPQ